MQKLQYRDTLTSQWPVGICTQYSDFGVCAVYAFIQTFLKYEEIVKYAYTKSPMVCGLIGQWYVAFIACAFPWPMALTNSHRNRACFCWLVQTLLISESGLGYLSPHPFNILVSELVVKWSGDPSWSVSYTVVRSPQDVSHDILIDTSLGNFVTV